jgi:hypothetical protein
VKNQLGRSASARIAYETSKVLRLVGELSSSLSILEECDKLYNESMDCDEWRFVASPVLSLLVNCVSGLWWSGLGGKQMLQEWTSIQTLYTAHRIGSPLSAKGM